MGEPLPRRRPGAVPVCSATATSKQKKQMNESSRVLKTALNRCRYMFGFAFQDPLVLAVVELKR